MPHFSAGEMPHQPEPRLSDAVYEEVQRNVVIACTDVALRDQATGKIFLGDRQTDPQIGPWFIGGRDEYNTGNEANAALQVAQDFHLAIPETSFKPISTYSTSFPIAGPGHDNYGRHTVNAVMLADLTPKQVAELNQNVADRKVEPEYSGGKWYDPSELAKPDSDFPYAIKQFVRELFSHDVQMYGVQTIAEQENARRNALPRPEELSKAKDARVASLEQMGFTKEEAADIETIGGPNALTAVMWGATASRQLGNGDLSSVLGEYTDPGSKLGDYQVKKALRSWGITPPEVVSENGPTLQSILRAARAAATYNTVHEGTIFDGQPDLVSLGHPGPHHEEEL